jgi:hypothetical protein
MGENAWSAVGPAIFVFLICLGSGSCSYLSSAGLARQTEARAALIAAESCKRKEPRS